MRRAVRHRATGSSRSFTANERRALFLLRFELALDFACAMLGRMVTTDECIEIHEAVLWYGLR